MTTITFNPLTTDLLEDWHDDNIWSPAVVPNGPDVDVVAPTIYYQGSPRFYYLRIMGGEPIAIRSLYLAASNALEIQTSLSVSGAVVVDSYINVFGGTLNAGSFTGEIVGASATVNVSGVFSTQKDIVNFNDFTISAGSFTCLGKLVAHAGTLTINVPNAGFGDYVDGALIGGVYRAENFATLRLNVGGPLTTLATTLEFGGGQMAFFDPSIQQYVNITSSLQTIASGGLMDLQPGGNPLPFGALTDNGDILLDGVALFAPTSLHIGAGGVLTGADRRTSLKPVAVNAPIVNDGVIAAEGDIFDDLIGTPTPLDLVVKQTVTGRGYFDFVSPWNEDGFGSFHPATLELQSAQSQNVVFDNLGTLQLDDPSQFTGAIATRFSPTPVPFTVALQNVNYDDVTGYSYAGNDRTGVLTIDTTAGYYTLRFLGNFETDDFTLSAAIVNLSTLPPMLDVAVAPHLASKPVVFGEPAQQVYAGLTTVDPFASIKVVAYPTLAAKIVLSAPKAGALSLPDASSYGVTNVSYNAATGTFTMDGEAASLSAALRALVFTPSFDGVARGFARDVKLFLTVSDSVGSTTAHTDVFDYNGVSLAAALGGQTNGFTAAYDSATDLTALTAQQISQLAANGITRLVSDDASVVYNAAQSIAIFAAHLTLGAPAGDSATEQFANKTVRFDFNASGFLDDRVTTAGNQIDTLHFQSGSVVGENYLAYDVRDVGGQEQSVYYYAAGPTLVATETFPAAGVTEFQLAGPREIYEFTADAHDVTLHFAAGFGTATVNGFNTPNAATDVLDISSLFPNFAAAPAAMTQASGTVIKDSLGDLLRIAGVAPSQLTSAQLGFG